MNDCFFVPSVWVWVCGCVGVGVGMFVCVHACVHVRVCMQEDTDYDSCIDVMQRT